MLFPVNISRIFLYKSLNLTEPNSESDRGKHSTCLPHVTLISVYQKAPPSANMKATGLSLTLVQAENLIHNNKAPSAISPPRTSQYYTEHLEFCISVVTDLKTGRGSALVGLVSNQTSVIHEISLGYSQGTSFTSEVMTRFS